MSDVDKLQLAEEAAAQRADQARVAERERQAAELREQPLRATAGKARTAASLALAQIHPGDNIRTDLPEIQELALSIRELGLLTPLLVRPWDAAAHADGALPAGADSSMQHYRLVAGHRRYAALSSLSEAGIDEHDPVRCEIREGLSEAETYALMLTENVQRVPLEPIQAARALRLLLDLNEDMTVASLARWLGLRPAWAQLHLKLLDLPDEVQARVESGDLSITIADLLRRAQSTGRLDEDKVLDLAAKAARGEITSAQVKAEAGPPRQPNTLAPKTVQLGPDGKPVEPAAAFDPRSVDGGRPATVPRVDAEPWPEASWPKIAETTGAARLSAPAHPGDERMARAQEQTRERRSPDEAGTLGDALAARLDSYLLGRALADWADDEYLADLGIDREQTEAYAAALSADERVMALRHLSLVLVRAEKAVLVAG